jgi:hypothetical protein
MRDDDPDQRIKVTKAQAGCGGLPSVVTGLGKKR